MIWQVIWSEKSVKQLEKINKKDSQRIFERIQDCKKDPFSEFNRLTN